MCSAANKWFPIRSDFLCLSFSQHLCSEKPSSSSDWLQHSTIIQHPLRGPAALDCSWEGDIEHLLMLWEPLLLYITRRGGVHMYHFWQEGYLSQWISTGVLVLLKFPPHTHNEAKSEMYSCMLLPANEELISVLLIALWNISGRIITAVQKSSQTMLSHGCLEWTWRLKYYVGLMIVLLIFITISWNIYKYLVASVNGLNLFSCWFFL